MLIKLLCGTELNPDHIIYIGHYNQDGNQVHFAQVVDHSFTLTDEEFAQIRAYHTKTVVVDGFAYGRYEEPITRPTKPFTVQELPKIKLDPEMKGIEQYVNRNIEQLNANCSICENRGGKSECDSCVKFEGTVVKQTKFQPKPQPDCSGAQHEEQVVRSCKSCAHLSSTFCPACGMSGFFPHWEPRA